MPTPTAVQTQPQQHRQARRDNRRFRPETFRQRQAERGAGGPARQQIGHGPARCGNDAHGGEAREGHVAHTRHHRQHRAQWSDETPDQQAGNPVLVEVGFCAVHPFRMLAQAGQAPDVLMEVAAQVIGNAVAQQAAEEAQQQGFTQRQRTAASQRGDCKQQYRAWHDQPGNRQTLHARDNKHRRCQPLWVEGQPAGDAIEPLAHTIHSMHTYSKTLKIQLWELACLRWRRHGQH